MRNYWLLKSEPGSWSWTQQLQKGIEPWNGVRNYQARNNLKSMLDGDQCFFYHSGKKPQERAIVGIVEVIGEYRLDPDDAKGIFGLRDVRAIRSLRKPVTLQEIRDIPSLQQMDLIKQPRLSVSAVTFDQWITILKLAGDSELPAI